MGKVKVRVLQPTVLASAGGPAHAEGTVEVDSDVADAAEALGAIERVGRGGGRKRSGAKATRKRTTASGRKRTTSRKTTATTPGASAAVTSGPLTKSDVPGAE
jgi:hypothetical protein